MRAWKAVVVEKPEPTPRYTSICYGPTPKGFSSDDDIGLLKFAVGKTTTLSAHKPTRGDGGWEEGRHTTEPATAAHLRLGKFGIHACVNPLECFVDYGSAHASFDLSNKNHVLMEVLMEGETITADSTAAAAPMPSLVAATKCTPIRVLTRDEMMAELLAAPPSPFISVTSMDDVVTVNVKRWEAKDETRTRTRTGTGDEDGDEYGDEHGYEDEHDGKWQEEKGSVRDLYVVSNEDWAQAVQHIRPLRVKMLLEDCVSRVTLTRKDWSPVSVGDDPSSMVVEGPEVFRATWTPNCPSRLLYLSNHGVEWQDEEGCRHRDGDKPAHIRYLAGEVTATHYTHGVCNRPSGLPTREVCGVRKTPRYSVYLTPEGKIGRPEEDGPALVDYRSKASVYITMDGKLHRSTGPAIFTDTDVPDSDYDKGICLNANKYPGLVTGLPTSVLACSLVNECGRGEIRVVKAWIEDGQFTKDTSVLISNGTKIWHRRHDETTWTSTWTRDGKRHVVWSDRNGQVKERVVEDACTNEILAKAYYRAGRLHSPDAATPAVVTTRGTAFYKDGTLHRDGKLPAVVLANDAAQYYYRNGAVYDPNAPVVPVPDTVLDLFKGLDVQPVRALNLLRCYGGVGCLSFSDDAETPPTLPMPLDDFFTFYRGLGLNL